MTALLAFSACANEETIEVQPIVDTTEVVETMTSAVTTAAVTTAAVTTAAVTTSAPVTAPATTGVPRTTTTVRALGLKPLTALQLTAAALGPQDVPGAVPVTTSGITYPCSDEPSLSQLPRRGDPLALRTTNANVTTLFGQLDDTSTTWAKESVEGATGCSLIHKGNRVERVDSVIHERTTDGVEFWEYYYNVVFPNGSTTLGYEAYFQAGSTVGAFSCSTINSTQVKTVCNPLLLVFVASFYELVTA